MFGFPNIASMIANAVASISGGNGFVNMATSIYQQIKTGMGVLAGVTVNTGGTTSTVKLYDGTSSVVTMTKASPAVITWVDHPFAAGNGVEFTTTGALYTGLTAGTTVFVSKNGLAADAFEVADTAAHAIAGTNTINTSGSESGVQTAWDVSNPIATIDTTTRGLVLEDVRFEDGLIAHAADGGSAADLTVTYN